MAASFTYNAETRKMIKRAYGHDVLEKTDIAYQEISGNTSPKLLGIGGFASVWELDDKYVRKVSIVIEDGKKRFFKRKNKQTYYVVEKAVKHDDSVAERIYQANCPYLVVYDKPYVRYKEVGKGKKAKRIWVWIYTLRRYESLTEQTVFKDKCIPFEMLCHIIKDICQGGAVLHELDIVHKDIHINNILHDAEYENGTTKGCYVLTDYGISGSLDYTSEDDMPYAVTNHFAGRKGFIPPEIKKNYLLRGDCVSTYKSDIWQLGMVLKSLVSHCNLTRNQKRAIKQIILKATKRNPSERYESFIQMKEAIQNIENIL